VNLTRIAHAIMLADGWRRAAIAFIAGAVSVLALAPINAWPILFVTFPVLVWIVDGAVGGKYGGVLGAAIAGWFFGFGYFLAGVYWVGYAFLVDAETFGWLLPIAVAGLPAYLALFPAAGLGLARLVARAGARAGACGIPHRHRMAARPSAQRIPLEHVRLRADRAAGAGASGGADRHLGADVSRGRDLRFPGDARRRARRYAAPLARAGDRRADPRRAHRLWRDAAVA
jgi:hypothetical protein